MNTCLMSKPFCQLPSLGCNEAQVGTVAGGNCSTLLQAVKLSRAEAGRPKNLCRRHVALQGFVDDCVEVSFFADIEGIAIVAADAYNCRSKIV